MPQIRIMTRHQLISLEPPPNSLTRHTRSQEAANGFTKKLKRILTSNTVKQTKHTGTQSSIKARNAYHKVHQGLSVRCPARPDKGKRLDRKDGGQRTIVASTLMQRAVLVVRPLRGTCQEIHQTLSALGS